jgi:hypothetical protein
MFKNNLKKMLKKSLFFFFKIEGNIFFFFNIEMMIYWIDFG